MGATIHMGNLLVDTPEKYPNRNPKKLND